MILSEKKLRQIVRDEVIKALTVEITWEKRRSEETGQPLAAPELRKEKVFLPAFWVQELYHQEAAFRGLQSDVHKNNSCFADLSGKVEAIGNLLLSMEQAVMVMAKFAAVLEERKFLEGGDVYEVARDRSQPVVRKLRSDRDEG